MTDTDTNARGRADPTGTPPAAVVNVRPAPPALGAATDVAIPEAYNLGRDRVRFGPIVAGLLSALTSLLLLGLLGVAIGLTAADGSDPGAGTFSAIWGALTGLIAFGLGGYVAGRTAAVFDRRWGALNGALVFMLGVPLTLWLAGQGLGFATGALGSFVGALNVDPAQVQGAAQGAVGQAQGAAAQVRPADVARVAEGARNAAWGALLGAALALGASALGGWLGTRRELELDAPATAAVATRRAMA
jgi:MFS family permease